jgi:hypothetical protein
MTTCIRAPRTTPGRESVSPRSSRPGKAFDDLYFLERAAKVQVLAQSTGGLLRSIGGDVARGYVREDRPNNLAKQAREHFEALLRILDREEPDYRD